MIEIKVLTLEGCRAAPLTVSLVQKVARELNLAFTLEQILITTPEQEVNLRFLGSPTVQINGQDADPAARSTTNFGFG